MRKIKGLLMSALILISMLALAFNVRTVKANPKTGETEKSFSVDDMRLPHKGTDQNKRGNEEQARIVEHGITALELEKLKQEIGVWEEGRNYNQIVNGYGTGLRPPTENEWNRIAEQAYMVEKVEWNNPTISASYIVDHTNSPWFPPIGDQDGEGSCTAWTVGYYMKTFQEAKEHSWNLSAAAWEGGYSGHPTPAFQDKIFSPDFIYHQINDGLDNGSYFEDAINLVCSIGASSWEKMPYDPDDSTSWPSEEAWREAPIYRGNSTGIVYLDLETDADIDDLKNWIASDHLAAIAVDGYQYDELTSDDVWTLDNYLDPSVNHANTIVGYDDDLEYTEEGVTRHGAFKVANSWGIGWWENIDDGCYWISYEAMKQRVGHSVFYQDRIGYDPKLVVSFKMDHSKRGECNITFGIGNKSAPIQTKRFDDWILDGGNNSFCSNNIVLDITEFKDAAPTVINQSFFMKVYDGGSATTGTIDFFSIEYYHNYSSGTLHAKSTSHDTPVNTANQDYVFAELTLKNIWTVDDDGTADFHTIQEAINAGNPGDTIYVCSGTYYEHVVANKSLTLLGEDRDTTIIDVNGTGDGVTITADNVTVTTFTIKSTGTGNGIDIRDRSNVTVKNTTVTEFSYGIYLWSSSNNAIYHNNFIDNTQNVYSYSSNNTWDDGYPSGGNYWSNYTGVDLYSGPYQNETGSDWIGDTPHELDASNRDRYPLTIPWRLNGNIIIPYHATAVYPGWTVNVTVLLQNRGADPETFNVTAYYDNHTIGNQTVEVAPEARRALTFTWDTKNVAPCEYNYTGEYYTPYTITVNVSSPTLDETIWYEGTVTVRRMGDANGDSHCKGLDFTLLAMSWWLDYGDLYYDPRADFNGDGDVKGADFTMLAMNWYEY